MFLYKNKLQIATLHDFVYEERLDIIETTQNSNCTWLPSKLLLLIKSMFIVWKSFDNETAIVFTIFAKDCLLDYLLFYCLNFFMYTMQLFSCCWEISLT